MKRINLLIGLPGSGKTTWLTNKDESKVFDDISQTDPYLERLTNAINKYEELWISDVNFANKKILDLAIEKINLLANEAIDFKFILFKQTTEECYRNVELRNDGRNVISTIKLYSKEIENTFNLIETEFFSQVEFVKLSNKFKP